LSSWITLSASVFAASSSSWILAISLLYVAISLLHDKENNSELVKAKTKLDAATSEEDPTPGTVTCAGVALSSWITLSASVFAASSSSWILVISLLNNSELVKAKTKLDAAIGEEDPTPGMTPATADNYSVK
jgi:hypothetical protein